MPDPATISGRSGSRSGAGRSYLLAGHCSVLAAATLSSLMARDDGNMLIVPLLPSRPGEVLNWVLPTGASVIGSGALPGSVVVRGSSAGLWTAALSNNALVLGVGAGGCFDRKDTE